MVLLLIPICVPGPDAGAFLVKLGVKP